MMENQINKEKIEQFYKTINSTTNSTIKKRNLKIIYDILLEQYHTSDNNFTIAHIGRLSKQKGGPSTQAIRNKQGEDYRSLIKYFEDNVTVVATTNNNINKDKNDSITDYIEDNTLKAHINIILAENKSLKNQLNILKNNMSKNYKLKYIENSHIDNTNINDILNNSEIESIQRFIGNIENNTIPLRETHSGAIKDENDILIASPGFLESLKKIIRLV